MLGRRVSCPASLSLGFGCSCAGFSRLWKKLGYAIASYSQRIEKVLRRWLALPYALVLSAARRLVLLFHFSDYSTIAAFFRALGFAGAIYHAVGGVCYHARGGLPDFVQD